MGLDDLDAYMREHVMCDHKRGQCGIADDRAIRERLLCLNGVLPDPEPST